MIYLDNAASTRLDDEVLKVMTPYFTQNYGNSQSQHAKGREAAGALIAARDKMASLINCNSDELYFVSGGTEAGNTAIKGACSHYKTGSIVLSAIEHPAMLESARDMQKHGFELILVYPDENGVISPESVEKALRSDTIFCGVMAANNETGVVQPVERIGKICRERGVFFYIDCVQTAGTRKIDASICDGLGVSSHKFYGPKGVGALYLRKGSKVDRLISGGMQESGFRGGTVNIAGIVGMVEAYSRACACREEHNIKLKKLRDALVSGVLSNIDCAKINGGGDILSSHANISFEGCDGERILFLLDLKGICVSTGAACSAGVVYSSHVLQAMGLSPSRVKSSIRFSFGNDNTMQEVETTISALCEIIKKIQVCA